VDARVDSPLHAGIVRKVVESRATLVLKDTHYLAPLRRSLFSNTDWNLIRLCPATLWLVKPRPLSVTPCIVAAVDPLHEHDKPAELDTKIVVAAAELAAATHGDVQLFHGVDVTPLVAAYGDGMPVPAPLPLYDLTEILRNEHREAVLGFAKEHGISSGRVHVAQGSVGSSLIALADEMRADVVVMGAISRSGLKRLFIGNTAETVLDRLSCDLLLVKPDVMPPDAN
jgi:universal stress protein E